MEVVLKLLLKSKLQLLFFLLFLNSFFYLTAQKPQVVLTSGHLDQVNALAMSSDGNILASGGNDMLLKLWDMSSGKEIRTLSGNDASFNLVLFSPNNKYVLGVMGSSQIKVWEIKTGKLLKKYEDIGSYGDVNFGSKEGDIVYINNNGKLATANFLNAEEPKENDFGNIVRSCVDLTGTKLFITTLDQKLKTYSLPELKELNTYPLNFGKDVHVATRIQVTRDNKYLAIPLYSNEIQIIDIATGKLYSSFQLDKSSVIIYDLKTKHLSSNIIVLDGVGNVHEYDLKQKKVIAKNKTTLFQPRCLETHPTQDYYLVNDFKAILFCKYGTGKIARTFETKANRLVKMSYDQQGKYLATAGTDISLKIWNLKENKIENVIQGFFPVQFSNDGQKLASMYRSISIAIWNPSTGELLNELNTENELIQCLAYSKDDKYIAGGGFLNTVKLWDASTGKLIKKFQGHTGGIYSVAFSPDGKYLASTSNDQTIKIWEISSGKLIKTLEGHTIVVSDCKFSDNGKYLVTSAWDKTIKIWNTSDWTLNKTLQGHISNVFTIDISKDNKYIVSGGGVSPVTPADNTIRIWEIESGKEICKMENLTGQINKVIFDRESDNIFSCSEDGIAKIWNWKECKEIAGFVAANTNDYLIYTPDNYYTCSKATLDAVSFRLEDKLYPFEQFDIMLNRPDIVAQRIGKTPSNLINAYTYVYKKRIKKMGFTEEQLHADFNLPKIFLVNDQLPVTTKQALLKFKVKCSDPTSNINRIQVYINNVPEFGINGIDLTKYKTNSIDYEIETALIVGKNKIQFTCINDNGVESMAQSFDILRESDIPVNGNLYVITIGVSEYQNNKYNLNYAAKDADDVMNQFLKSKHLYKQVFSKTLKNAEVTKENFLKLKDFLAGSTPDDAVIIFIAGHGVLDEKLDYYYCTNNIDFDKPNINGISYDEIEDLLNKTKAIRKLLFMDTCHSGELDKDEVEKTKQAKVEVGGVSFRAVGEAVVLKDAFGFESSVQLMENLFGNTKKGTGTTVISSSGGAEFAMESAEWKNGLFTFCLLNGIKSSKADSDFNKEISVTELQKYVSEQVKSLSKGRQKPTTRAENLLLDYRVW